MAEVAALVRAFVDAALAAQESQPSADPATGAGDRRGVASLTTASRACKSVPHGHASEALLS
ncbi:hypothetical protein AS594_39735 [Streptomyces agglomeratus]|uniref:Uncharacterized protein n=1 Tax=Streptomyces agglomeratus TaxID=285458 RepID=A0A1E5NZA4_9ACTN|nr:hypothetical protein AS594_39735 [Streptomyces agglomeratus]